MTARADSLAHSSATLTIDLDAIAANYAALRRRCAPAACGAVVKADAYGLGLEPIARRLAAEGCRHFFVAHPGEGAELRAIPDEGIARAAIYVTGGLSGQAPERLIEHNLIPALVTLDDVMAWRAAAQGAHRPLPAILYIDTGLNRLGIPFSQLERLSEEITASLYIHYVMSHLACAEEAAHPMNEEQRARFETVRARFAGVPASLANSSGVFLGPRFHYQLTRPGYAIYGGNPTPGANPMRAVLTLEAPILQVRELAKNDTVGYGATFRAEGVMRVATVGAGYADGIARSLSGGRGMALIAGKRAPFVGRVSMDLLTFDVTHLTEEEARPGALAQLIGPDLTIDDLADAAGTIGYELLTRLGTRFQRIYRGHPTS